MAAHGLQGLQPFFAAQGLHGLQPFLAAQGLHGLQAARRKPAGLFFATGKDLMVLDTGFTACAGPESVIAPPTTMPVPKSTGITVLDSSLDLNAFTVKVSP